MKLHKGYVSVSILYQDLHEDHHESCPALVPLMLFELFGGGMLHLTLSSSSHPDGA